MMKRFTAMMGAFTRVMRVVSPIDGAASGVSSAFEMISRGAAGNQRAVQFVMKRAEIWTACPEILVTAGYADLRERNEESDGLHHE